MKIAIKSDLGIFNNMINFKIKMIIFLLILIQY